MLKKCVKLFLSISDSNFRRLGLPHRHFRLHGEYSKIDLSCKSPQLNEFQVTIPLFLVGSGTVFLIFEAFKTSLKTKRFSAKGFLSIYYIYIYICIYI